MLSMPALSLHCHAAFARLRGSFHAEKTLIKPGPEKIEGNTAVDNMPDGNIAKGNVSTRPMQSPAISDAGDRRAS